MKTLFKLFLALFASSAFAVVNINTATKEELMSISGIGEVKAQAIIDYRKNNKFNSIEDLINVNGIGAETLKKISSDITVSGKTDIKEDIKKHKEKSMKNMKEKISKADEKNNMAKDKMKEKTSKIKEKHSAQKEDLHKMDKKMKEMNGKDTKMVKESKRAKKAKDDLKNMKNKDK